MSASSTVQSKFKILCEQCDASPIAGTPLFADGYGDDGRPIRYCPDHLPLAAVQARLERKEGPLLDPDVRAVFTRRLAEESR